MNPQILLAIVLLPLVAAVLAGLLGRYIGRIGAHSVAIAGVGMAFLLCLNILWQVYWQDVPSFDAPVYTWLVSDSVTMQVGFLIDRLSALMMVVVTFVSLCVHIYTIGYMRDDPGYQRFFSYISLFTFAILMLVMANNFMQLFFGWEGVGVVSYLLIGFWYTRPTATAAGLKAFLVNRVGDFGFVLGIAGVLYYTGSLHYSDAFSAAPQIATQMLPMSSTQNVQALTLICICLFVGAMGKSAQVPLHVWLPDSMEGPTPISALIHAATMVTAGIFMVARMSPLFEYSETALSFVLVIGATTAFFMGLLGIVNNDIKRVIAYSTLSQLGYMTVALGVSAGHEEDGRPCQVHAHHGSYDLDRGARAHRHAVLFRLLFKRHDHRGGGCLASLGSRLRLLLRAGWRVRHRALYVPNVVHDVSRPGALPSRRAS